MKSLENCISNIINLKASVLTIKPHRSITKRKLEDRQKELLRNEMNQDVDKHAGFDHVLSNVVFQWLSNHFQLYRSHQEH